MAAHYTLIPAYQLRSQYSAAADSQHHAGWMHGILQQEILNYLNMHNDNLSLTDYLLSVRQLRSCSRTQPGHNHRMVDGLRNAVWRVLSWLLDSESEIAAVPTNTVAAKKIGHAHFIQNKK